jgi:hypothetical protein
MIEFMDGFDHYNVFTWKWDTGGNVDAIFQTGRFGGLAANIAGSIPLTQGQLSAQTTRILGFAFQVVSGQAFNNNVIANFELNGTTQCDLRTTSGGALQVTRNGTGLGTSTVTMVPGTWYYIEIKVTINTSTGSFDVHLNGNSIVSASGVNTANATGTTTNQLLFGGGGGNYLFDDVYILNLTGSSNTDFRGDSRIITNLPNADGASSQWTPNSGSPHFSRVNENPPDSDTTYVSDSSSGDLDLYGFATITPTGPIYAVQTCIAARKDDTGVRQISESCRSGSVNYFGLNVATLTVNYLIYREIREVDPATGVTWTTSGLNSAQFGQVVVPFVGVNDASTTAESITVTRI